MFLCVKIKKKNMLGASYAYWHDRSFHISLDANIWIFFLDIQKVLGYLETKIILWSYVGLLEHSMGF